MSIDKVPQNNPDQSGQELRTFILNNNEVLLTAEQAAIVGAVPLGHSGDLGLERPAEGAIPITHVIPADDIPDSMPLNRKDRRQQKKLSGETSWYQSKAAKIGGVIIGGIATVTTLVATQGGDTAPQDKPSVSAPANTEPTISPQEPTETTPVESPDAVVGQPGSTLENISVKPSNELIQKLLAIEPTVENFPTAADFVRFVGIVENITNLAGQVSAPGDFQSPMTSEATKLRNKLNRLVYTDGYIARTEMNKEDAVDRFIAAELQVINELGYLTTSDNKGKIGTWHVDFNPNEDAIAQVDKNTFKVPTDVTIISNFHEFDDLVTNVLTDYAPEMNISTTYTIVLRDGTWAVDDTLKTS